jgi:3-phosphoshikimate 1-carboxyvinyltransferase
VEVRDVGINPTRTGFYEVLRDMGASLEVVAKGEELGEPLGLIGAAGSVLRGARVGGETIARAIDEVPILAVVAARASGTTTIVDAAELRAKESDRIRAVAAMLRAFGVGCEELEDGLVIEGRSEGRLRACVVETEGDHRIAMSAAVLALAAEGETRVRDAGSIATSFPRFVGTLRALGADVRVG